MITWVDQKAVSSLKDALQDACQILDKPKMSNSLRNYQIKSEGNWSDTSEDTTHSHGLAIALLPGLISWASIKSFVLLR